MTALTLGGASSSADVINERGQVAGTSYTVSGDQHAFLWSNGRIADLGTLGGSYSYAYGLNNDGDVTGISQTATGEEHVFLWKHGTMRDLGPLGVPAAINDAEQIALSGPAPGTDGHAFVWQRGNLSDLGDLGYVPGLSHARAMNQSGQVVGYSPAPSGFNHAFLGQSRRPMVDLGTLRADQSGSSDAVDVNRRGHVVGTASSDPNYFTHGFIWRDGAMTDLGTLGGQGSFAYALNNDDKVVGLSATSDGGSHAFFWSNDQMTDLGTLSGRSGAYAINDDGTVAGDSYAANGELHAVLWSKERER
jgi:probable HAF family extracellular repeat protein